MEANVIAMTDSCPTCGSSISQAKLAEIQKRQERERRTLREAMRADLEREHREALEKREADLRRELAAEAEREREAALGRQRKLLEAERDSAKTELANVRGELDRVRSKFEEDLAGANARAAKLEQERTDWSKQETERIETLVKAASAAERTSLVRERDEAKAQQAQMKTEAEAREADHQKELAHQREVLGKDKERTLAVKDSEAATEREALKRQVADLTRKLESKTASELGDGGEVDLYEELRAAFPHDRITRIQKGQPGADIRHQVVHNGEVCGTILYDSKNHTQWRTSFAEKLKADQTEEGADYAILSTLRFPQGTNHVTTVSDVVVVGPRHAAHIAQLMRRSIISLHIQGLSLKDRAGKQQDLYKHITSNAFRQQLEELERLNDQIAEIDVEEESRHRRTWKARGTLITRQKRVLMDVMVGIDGIIEGAQGDEDA